jgi:hypothetical protein
MKDYRIFSLDLNQNGQNYASFSGYLISRKNVSNDQLNSISQHLSDDHQTLSIKSFDREGEDLEDYCSDFPFFDLNEIGDSCIVVLDINNLEEGNCDDLGDTFLTNDNGDIVSFHPDGNISSI